MYLLELLSIVAAYASDPLKGVALREVLMV